MSIQDTFYLLGSIYLGLGIIVSVGILALVIYVFHVVSSLKRHVEENLYSIKHTVDTVGEAAQEVTSQPFAGIGNMGKLLLQILGYGLGRVFR